MKLADVFIIFQHAFPFNVQMKKKKKKKIEKAINKLSFLCCSFFFLHVCMFHNIVFRRQFTIRILVSQIISCRTTDTNIKTSKRNTEKEKINQLFIDNQIKRTIRFATKQLVIYCHSMSLFFLFKQTHTFNVVCHFRECVCILKGA